MTQKLYIRTFGCQMNEYDSDKMADVLAADGGLALTDRPVTPTSSFSIRVRCGKERRSAYSTISVASAH